MKWRYRKPRVLTCLFAPVLLCSRLKAFSLFFGQCWLWQGPALAAFLASDDSDSLLLLPIYEGILRASGERLAADNLHFFIWINIPIAICTSPHPPQRTVDSSLFPMIWQLIFRIIILKLLFSIHLRKVYFLLIIFSRSCWRKRFKKVNIDIVYWR